MGYHLVWPFWFVAVSVCGRFSLWPFRSLAVSVCGLSVCGRFGLWRFRFVALSVCGRFGLWPFRSVAFSVCGRFGLWPFRFVAFSVCGRFGLWPLWHVTIADTRNIWWDKPLRFFGWQNDRSIDCWLIDWLIKHAYDWNTQVWIIRSVSLLGSKVAVSHLRKKTPLPGMGFPL